MTGALALLLALPAAISAAEKAKEDSAVIRQDITIKGAEAGAPPVRLPPPSLDPAVLREVAESLELVRREHRGRPAEVALEATRRRLAQPFPKAPFLSFKPKSRSRFDHWVFEVLGGEGGEALWRQSGDEPIEEPLEWDGSGFSAGMAARVDRSYRLRFTGRLGKEEFLLVSEPLRVSSLAYREFSGERRLEVSNSLLFERGKPGFALDAGAYLNEMGDRMRRAAVREGPYRLVLYQKDPASRLAKARARSLAGFFSKYLLVSPARVSVSVEAVGDRGDATACLLPPDLL